MTIKEIETLALYLQSSLNNLVRNIGQIIIGNKKQFPLGWRNAAKGRTVWRIIEEIVIQNLQTHSADFNLADVEFSDSEVSVFDFKCTIEEKIAFVNIKSAVLDGIPNKDDISKPDNLKQFFNDDQERQIFIATFFIKFNDDPDISVEIDSVTVFPLVWIPDIYVNPSNNGNLQSSKYKSLSDASKRTNQEFLILLNSEIENAAEKKRNKNAPKEV
jgi:hypothetical protein